MKNRAPLIVQTFPTSDLDDHFQNSFRTAVASRGLRYVRQVRCRSERALEKATAPDFVRSGDEVLFDGRDDCDVRLTLARGENVISLFCCAKYGAVTIWVAGRELESVERCIGEHAEEWDDGESPTGPEVPAVACGFWYIGGKGQEREEKALQVPSWQEIRDNYAATTAAAIDRLVFGFKPGVGGRLLLWHGPPGTGKTFALRSLAWEWREWCQFEYILDPENLFGSRADYLAKMVLDGNEQGTSGSRWRVLILEDTGELLGIDAKERAGQGLSRLLNAVDGLLGQGSRILLLITTNEELGTLHPAVTRPGRCFSQVEFLPLSPSEGKSWLDRYDGIPGIAIVKPRTIAELYALRDGMKVPETTQLGFLK